MAPTEVPDYRDFLKNELIARIQRNSKYSARALARDLGVSSPYLSQILSNKRTLSEKKALGIARDFKWNQAQSSLFVSLVRYQLNKDPYLKKQILEEIGFSTGGNYAFYDLKLDVFDVVSTWYDFAIVELTSVKNFVSTPKWIANKLGISTVEAETSISRLKRVGLLIVDGGRLKKSKENYGIKDVPSEAIRSFHDKHLSLAKEALHSQGFAERDFSGITMAIDPRKIPEAKKMIQKCRREIMNLLEMGSKTSVYHLSIELFRLDKKD